MKPSEFDKTARAILAPWCKENGFRRLQSSLLGWYKSADERFLIFWLQRSQSGWDHFAGSSFVVEFQISDRPVPGLLAFRKRFTQLLTDEELQQVSLLQNGVISKLKPPPDGYSIYHLDQKHVDRYLDLFKLVSTRYEQSGDIWFRYRDESDVKRWLEFIVARLPGALDRLRCAFVANVE